MEIIRNRKQERATILALDKLIYNCNKLLLNSINLSSWCLVMVWRLFLAVPRGCLRFVIVVFPDHIHLLFTISNYVSYRGGYLSNLLKAVNTNIK